MAGAGRAGATISDRWLLDDRGSDRTAGAQAPGCRKSAPPFERRCGRHSLVGEHAGYSVAHAYLHHTATPPHHYTATAARSRLGSGRAERRPGSPRRRRNDGYRGPSTLWPASPGWRQIAGWITSSALPACVTVREATTIDFANLPKSGRWRSRFPSLFGNWVGRLAPGKYPRLDNPDRAIAVVVPATRTAGTSNSTAVGEACGVSVFLLHSVRMAPDGLPGVREIRGAVDLVRGGRAVIRWASTRMAGAAIVTQAPGVAAMAGDPGTGTARAGLHVLIVERP